MTIWSPDHYLGLFLGVLVAPGDFIESADLGHLSKRAVNLVFIIERSSGAVQGYYLVNHFYISLLTPIAAYIPKQIHCNPL